MGKTRLHNISFPNATLPMARLAGSVAANRGYIKDGLVFHLDGIDKGPKDGIWTDLVGGVEFSPYEEAEWGPNYVAGSLAADVAVAFPADTSTIECCIRNKVYITENKRLFNSGVCGSICTGITNSNRLLIVQCHNYGNYSFYDKTFCSAGPHVISANKNLMLHNRRADHDVRTLDYWINREPRAIIGSTEDIEVYSIRIYDRLLTEDEMYKNQQADIRRFGLTIPETMTLELDDEDYASVPAFGLGQDGL